MTKDRATAAELVARSPLTYELSVPQHVATSITRENQSKDNPHGVTAATSQASESAAPTSHTGVPEGGQRQFQLHVFPADEHNHAVAAVANTPYHRSWPPDFRDHRSIMKTTLKQSLPQNLAADGLAHWLLDFEDRRQGSKKYRLEKKGWMPGLWRQKKGEA